MRISSLRVVLGAVIALIVYISLGFKQIKSEEEEEADRSLRRQNSNLHPDDMSSKGSELMCISYRGQRKFE